MSTKYRILHQMNQSLLRGTRCWRLSHHGLTTTWPSPWSVGVEMCDCAGAVKCVDHEAGAFEPALSIRTGARRPERPGAQSPLGAKILPVEQKFDGGE
jgi:hypothetical protein